MTTYGMVVCHSDLNTLGTRACNTQGLIQHQLASCRWAPNYEAIWIIVRVKGNYEGWGGMENRGGGIGVRRREDGEW